MNEKNTYLGVLGAGSLVLLVVAGIFWGVGVGGQNESLYSDSTAGLAQMAIAGGLFQLGTLAGLLWLLAHAIIAQLAYKPAEQRRAEESAKRADAAGA